MGILCLSKKAPEKERFGEDAFGPCKRYSYLKNNAKHKNTTALIDSTRLSHLTCLVILIETGADVNETNRIGETALHCHSLQHGLSHYRLCKMHLRCIKLLLEYGANVNICDKFVILLLHKAAQEDHTKCVEMLIDAGANVNASDVMGNTALSTAAKYGRFESMKKLVELGADVNMVNNKGVSLVHLPTESGFDQCLKYLVLKGADVNIRNDDKTPVMVTAVLYAFS